LHARSGVLGRLADLAPPQVPKLGDWPLFANVLIVLSCSPEYKAEPRLHGDFLRLN
jgi:hypothetical protein